MPHTPTSENLINPRTGLRFEEQAPVASPQPAGNLGTGPIPPAPEAVERRHPTRQIDFPGHRLILLSLTPVGLFGIAVGATTVLLKLATPAAHIWGLLIIWTATVGVSTLALLTGVRESADYHSGRSQTGPSEPRSSGISPGTAEQPSGNSHRFESLKPLSPQS